MVLLLEAGHLLEGGNDEGDVSQLGPGDEDLVLIKRECLKLTLVNHSTNIASLPTCDT